MADCEDSEGKGNQGSGNMKHTGQSCRQSGQSDREGSKTDAACQTNTGKLNED